MKRNTAKHNAYLILLFSVLLGYSSCKKDRSPAEVITKPSLTNTIPNNGKDTITIGGSVTLHPKLDVKKGLSYVWLVNDIEVGKDSVFTFNPTARGDYQIKFKAVNASGEAMVNYQIYVYGKYENGFFIANEGWFGTEPSSVNFYRYDTQTLEEDIYKKENPDKHIGKGTLQFATIYKDRLYLVNKVSGAVVATDAYSMKEVGRTDNGSYLAFAGIDDNRGLLTATNGIYPLNLQTFEVGARIAGVTGSGGDIFKAGNYVFAIVGKDAVVLNANDYSVKKTLAKVQMGFAQTPDGNVWCATSDGFILKINPQTLDMEEIEVNYAIPGNSVWRSTPIMASTKENAIFIRSGNNIYKYPFSVYKPFFNTLPPQRGFYGTGIGYNPKTNQLVATLIKGVGYDAQYNDLLFIDAASGEIKKKVSYEHIYFPAMPVFHK